MTIHDIQTAVATRFGVTVLDLRSARRGRHVVRARHIAMWLAARLTAHSLATIGRHFGDRDHSTVHHALWRIDQLMRRDANVVRQVTGLLASVDCVESVQIRRAMMRAAA